MDTMFPIHILKIMSKQTKKLKQDLYKMQISILKTNISIFKSYG